MLPLSSDGIIISPVFFPRILHPFLCRDISVHSVPPSMAMEVEGKADQARSQEPRGLRKMADYTTYNFIPHILYLLV